MDVNRRFDNGSLWLCLGDAGYKCLECIKYKAVLGGSMKTG